jgi:vesicular inhibitory amino acid transporter
LDDGDDVSPRRHSSNPDLAGRRRYATTPRRLLAKSSLKTSNANQHICSSSVTNHLAAIADIGGVNSLASFARSWQRAAGFQEVIPRRPSFVYADESGPAIPEGIQYGRSHVEPTTPGPETSLLRRHLEASPPQNGTASSAAEQQLRASVGHGASAGENDGFRERESKAFDAEMASGALQTTTSHGSPSTRDSIFNIPPHLSEAPIIGSYGSWRSSHYGTIGGGSLRARSRTSVGDIWPAAAEDEEGEEDAAHGEHEPILVREVKQGDKVILTVEGQSTLPQSVFNSINAIIGVGLLSLPLAFSLSGWIVGLFLLTLTALTTAYTSKLLAKCMDYDASLITYSDLAYVSFGSRARIVVSALFTLELVAACVALVILFADSLYLLLPGVASVNAWKCVCALLVLMLNALPLRFLSYTSVIGIFSTFCSKYIVLYQVSTH